MKKIGVILCGCGYLDGSEIREAVGVYWALSQLPVAVQTFAPDKPQRDVVNTLLGQPAQNESRNMLVEAARIARGKIQSLSQINVSELSGLIMPGGYGAAKNLCDFALKGSNGTVLPEMEKVLKEFRAQGKPIGAICISPAIVALTFKGAGLEMTVGAPCEASQEIEKLGHKHVVRKANEIHVDQKHKVVTTPAYMYGDAPLHEIMTGIQKLATEVVRLA